MIEQFFPRLLSNVCCGIFLLALGSASQSCRAQATGSSSVATQEAIPEPAIQAILKAFDTFEVVGMPAAHGQKDIDDFILSLIRDPRFPTSVNDIAVECGNVRYQPLLDRYIAGEDVPFTEVQHVWRDTTVQQMCGSSGFYEQLYPLVRSLNQHLPAASRLRVVAADPTYRLEQNPVVPGPHAILRPGWEHRFRDGKRSAFQASQGVDALWSFPLATRRRSGGGGCRHKI